MPAKAQRFSIRSSPVSGTNRISSISVRMMENASSLVCGPANASCSAATFSR
jgi:hypothetical protein